MPFTVCGNRVTPMGRRLESWEWVPGRSGQRPARSASRGQTAVHASTALVRWSVLDHPCSKQRSPARRRLEAGRACSSAAWSGQCCYLRRRSGARHRSCCVAADSDADSDAWAEENGWPRVQWMWAARGCGCAERRCGFTPSVATEQNSQANG
jgi:hypothetical protein